MKTLTACLIFFSALIFSEKVFSQIDTSWVKRYPGSQNMDEAKAILLDASNNVYVTGRSLSTANGYDIVTIKYNTSGTVLWTAIYDGTGHSTDEGNSIVSDGSNIYVTGVTTRSPSTGLDYVTIKYNASTGVPIWTSVFNGIGNLDDIATKIAYKNSSIYVTGKGYYRGAADADYVTIKYNSNTGDSTWIKAYNGPGSANDSATAVRVTTDSSIIVTGKSFGIGNYDFATVKYSASGTQNWFKRLNGPANSDDFGTNITFNSGLTTPDIYVTGISQGTGTGYDIFTVKYTNAGVESWNRRYNGAGNGDDNASAFAYKNDNEIYLTGKAQTASSGSDLILLKYDFNGNLNLTVTYNGSANSNDEGTALTFDASGFVYVAGKSNETSTGDDYVVIKYTTSGNPEWIYKYNRSGSGSDIPFAIAVDATVDRNVFVTGTSFSGTTGTNYATLKLKQDLVLDLNIWIQGFYRPSTNSMIRDTVRVYLYNSTATTILDSGKIFLDTLGKGRLYFKKALNGVSYYIVVRHRNTLETWNISPSSFSNLYKVYDFTTAASKAYGNNQIQVDASPVEFAVYNGDVNQDGAIDLTDLVSVYNDGNSFLSGYVQTDVNGDNFVDLSDLVITYNNSIAFVNVIRP